MNLDFLSMFLTCMMGAYGQTAESVYGQQQRR